MSSSLSDYQLANAAAGFTLGFGVLTVWEAIKQTKRLKNPWRSVYIYMVWGEIIANLAILVICWLLLNNKISASILTYFFILFFWAFEIHLILQLIINRLSVVVSNRKFANRVKWSVAVIITIVNIAVFCIFIPSHLVPPPHPMFVTINKYWDKATKFIILFIDAGLNYFFLHTVKDRLVRDCGLKRYSSLASFNARLMALSVLMDVMIIGLMFMPNQLVFTQFHPVAYMVKLNVELSMANLIRKIATGTENDFIDTTAETSNGDRYNTHALPRNQTGRSMKNGVIGFDSTYVDNDDFQLVSRSVEAGRGGHMKAKSEDETRIIITQEYEIRQD